MGKRHRAVKDLSRAIDLNPNLADAHYHRGMAYRDMGRMDRAVRDFGAAVELERNYGLAYYARGITNVNLGAHEAALGDFDGRGLRPVPGARARQRRGPCGPGAGPQQPGAA